MQFTHDLGIVSTKTELDAILGFCADSDDAQVAFRVKDGKFVACASNGLAAVYHHGPAYDGAGGPAYESCIWQVNADILHMVKGAMGKLSELVLVVADDYRLVRAEIRSEASGESQMAIDLDGKCQEQAVMPWELPERPLRHTGEIPTSELVFSYKVQGLLKKVCVAAGTDACRYLITSNPHHPVYVEVDKLKNLADEEQARWVCILCPMKLDSLDVPVADAGVAKSVRQMRKSLKDLGATMSVSVNGEEV